MRYITDVYDVGCVHGMVVILVTGAYPKIHVHAVDIEPRDSFVVQREAYTAVGERLDNLNFKAGDLSSIGDSDLG